MNNEQIYLNAINHVATRGEVREDRTGTGTLSVFGEISMKFDLRKGFPLITTKKIFLNSVIAELYWFLNGMNDVNWLEERNCKIWTPWKKADGTIGLGSYGLMWRDFHGVDQIAKCLELLRTEPHSRRILVNAWDASQNDDAALPPCHFGFQFNSQPREQGGRWLDLSYFMRSNDLFLGAPFNIASYGFLLCMVAKLVGMTPRFLSHHVVGDAHVYMNHLSQVHEQLSREPLSPPTVEISDDIFQAPLLQGLDTRGLDPIHVLGYNHHPALRAPIAV